ncbi:MAG: TspO/MBR family protein [Pseudomonadota bacterium]
MMWISFAIFLMACGAAATTGAMFGPDEWYRNLDKPSWNPPDWLFPVAWTFLYLAMSYAGARLAVLHNAGLPLALWALQIALNTLWTPIFFGLKDLKAAMIVIVFLMLSVVIATIVFFQYDSLAGWLFLPYAIWVSYAAALNWSILQRNPQPA